MCCRKVQNESATGSVSVNKVRTTLTIRIEAIDFDTQGCVLRVRGRNIEENQYVKVKYVILNIILKLCES
jgi:protein pelota